MQGPPRITFSLSWANSNFTMKKPYPMSMTLYPPIILHNPFSLSHMVKKSILLLNLSSSSNLILIFFFNQQIHPFLPWKGYLLIPHLILKGHPHWLNPTATPTVRWILRGWVVLENSLHFYMSILKLTLIKNTFIVKNEIGSVDTSYKSNDLPQILTIELK